MHPPTGENDAPLLKRPPLREQIREIVRGWLISGELKPGSDINERELAEELGASRTPVREALLLLALEGFVSLSPYRGYFVAPLTAEEAHQLYPLIGALERYALLRGGLPGPEAREEMDSMDADRRSHSDPGQHIELDRAWHDALLSGSDDDEVLNEELSRVKNRVTRYEQAFQREAEEVKQALEEHAGILDALDDGDLDAAAERLEAHWHSALATLPRWLPEHVD